MKKKPLFSTTKRYLLIGNGPSAIKKKVGELIDNFDGAIVRFNDYKTEGYEEYVGTRVDIWNTVHPYTKDKNFEAIFYLKGMWDEMEEVRIDSIHEYYGDIPVFKIDPDTFTTVLKGQESERVRHNASSSGSILTEFLLSTGCEVWIYGFDFFQNKVHHYSDTLHFSDRVHSSKGEKDYFDTLIADGRVRVFANDEPDIDVEPHPKMYLVAEPGADIDKWVNRRFIGNVEVIANADKAYERCLELISEGKEVWACGYGAHSQLQQLLVENKVASPVAHTTAITHYSDLADIPASEKFSDWYDWIADSLDGKSVLVIGRDPIHAVRRLSEYGITHVETYLIGGHESSFLRDIPPNSFDCVICLECLPYMINDLLVIRHGKRICKEKFVCGYEVPSHFDNLGKPYARRVMLHRVFFGTKFDEFWLGNERGDDRKLVIEKRGDKYWDFNIQNFTDTIYHLYKTYPVIIEDDGHYSQCVLVSHK